MRFKVSDCQENNIKYKTEQACKDAHQDCCFACNNKFDCGGNMPRVATCANGEPSAFMKKCGRPGCDSDKPIELSTETKCGGCASLRDLFVQYDAGRMYSNELDDDTYGVGAAKSGFHGGVNLHNVGSTVSIDDKNCPAATAGVLIKPHNSGDFKATGKKDTVYAIFGVVNNKPTDPTKGVKLGGAANYLLIGGSNAGNVDITTTGKVSVIGLDNTGKVNAKGVDHTLIGNVGNSGNVVVDGGKTGAMVNVANKDKGVVLVKGGTWKLHDVSNAKGGKVCFDGGDFEITGAGSRNDGTLELKKGQINLKLRENTGTITIADGVTGLVMLCKQSGKTDNKGKATVAINPDDPFCKLEVPKPAVKPAPSKPKLFYCRNAKKYREIVWEKKGERWDRDILCSRAVAYFTKNWKITQLEPHNPDIASFFKKCCDAKRVAPQGQKYELKKRLKKRKRVRAKTRVSLDFTDGKNEEKKSKFEKVYVKRAKAASGKFTYTRSTAKSTRRHLSGGSEVDVILEYDDDKTAEEGKTAVTNKDFGTGVQEDLKKEGVETTVTENTATVEEVEEEVVEEVLVNDPDATTTAPKPGGTTTKGGATTKADTKTKDGTTKKGDTKTKDGTTTKGDTKTKDGTTKKSSTTTKGDTKKNSETTTPVLSAATPTLPNLIIAFVNSLVVLLL